MSAREESGNYEPATIRVLDRDGSEIDAIDVLFNPTEYSLEKSVEYGELSLPGMDTPVTQFVSGDAETLSMDLLVDTYDSERDVREHIERLDRLVTVDGERHAPPICQFVWGGLEFKAVVESLNKTFRLFMPDGYPVRADVSLSFKRYEPVEKQLEKEDRDSPDRTKRRRLTDTGSLWALAAREYGDPTRWRVIAEANDISDPRDVEAGAELVVPPLDS